MKYSDGLQSTRKDDGIDRCLLAAIAPGNDEGYEFLKQCFSMVKVKKGKVYSCSDLKVNNTTVGIMSHSARYPCHGCHWKNGTEEDQCELRTFEGIRAYHEAWVQSGSDPSKLKEYFNCRNKPLDIFPETGIVILLVSPSSLHLKIGIVNLLWDGMVDVFPGGAEWATQVHITKAAFFGGHFQGRQCDKLLSTVSVLKQIVEADVTPRATRSSASSTPTHPAQPFIRAFEDLSAVVKACFGFSLADDYVAKIQKFKSSFGETGFNARDMNNEQVFS